MKKLIFLLSATVISSLPRAAEGQTYQKTYDGDAANDVSATIDGNFVVAGRPCFLLKVDQSGNMLWHKNYGTTAGGAEASSVEQTPDGGYLVAGTLNGGYPISKVLLFKADSDGNFQWSKTFGGSGAEFGQSITRIFDGNYLIAGITESFSAYQDVYIIKVDSNGDTLWTRTFDGGYSDYGYSILPTSDSNFVFCGTISMPGSSNNVLLVKVDQNGNLIWSKSYGGSDDDGGYFVSQTADGGYAIAGYTDSFGAGQTDAYLIKTDSAGNLKWSKAFGDAYNDELYYAEEMTDGSYFLAGYAILAGNRWVSGIKTDATGDTLWANMYGGPIGQTGFSATKSATGYMIAGATSSFGLNQIYLIQADSVGYSGCYESNIGVTATTPATIETNPLIQVSSPPTIADSIGFNTTNANAGNTLCSLLFVNELPADSFSLDGAKRVIINMWGQLVPQGTVLSDGIYIFRYEKHEKSFSRKIVVIN